MSVGIDFPRLTITGIAEELGIPRATLEAYRLGTRRMPPETRARLAAYLTAQADGLARLARAIAGGAGA